MWVAFFWHETRAGEPIINPRLFSNRVFTVSSLASAIQSAAMFGAIMFLPLFVQGVLGKTATNSGIILMPLMAGAIVTSIVAGQILAAPARYKALVIAGYICVATGAFLMSRMGIDTTWTTLISRHGRHGPGPGRRDERLHGDRAEPVPDRTGSARSPPACSSSGRSAAPSAWRSSAPS